MTKINSIIVNAFFILELLVCQYVKKMSKKISLKKISLKKIYILVKKNERERKSPSQSLGRR